LSVKTTAEVFKKEIIYHGFPLKYLKTKNRETAEGEK
jgi:hypothetical protein